MSKGLTLDAVRVSLEGKSLVAIDDHLAPGEVLTVMGPSGSGKSTLLAVLIGAAPREFEISGRVLVDGDDLTCLGPRARRIGILFQDDLLFPHLSVGANLAFALPAGVRGRAARRARVEEALADAGLEGFAGGDPATLSGGQRARVALMRTLLSEPRALLLDEPFSRLDAGLRGRMRDFVFTHARRRRLPTILVTHDKDDAAAACGRIISPLGETGDPNGHRHP